MKVSIDNLNVFPEHIKEQIYKQHPELRPQSEQKFTGVKVLDKLQTRVMIVVDGVDLEDVSVSELMEKSFEFKRLWKNWIRLVFIYGGGIRNIILPPEIQYMIFEIMDMKLFWDTFRKENNNEEF